jgi:hypothetical protein
VLVFDELHDHYLLIARGWQGKNELRKILFLCDCGMEKFGFRRIGQKMEW